MGDEIKKPVFSAYQPENLAEVLAFVGECNRLTNFGEFQAGDIAHWMSSYCKGRDLSDHFGLYRDAETGELVALSYTGGPKNFSFELILHPRYRGSALELDLLKDTQQRTLQQVQALAVDTTNLNITSTLIIGDAARKDCLEKMGFRQDPQYIDCFNSRSLHDPIPEPALPEGFTIRRVAREAEIGPIVEVHNSSFGGKWTESLYLEVMRTPSFEFGREMVVVAPEKDSEGHPVFAAFCIYWLDPVSKSGLFEPVGCHKDFQRKGLTKALMYAGMHLMKAAGMETALVLFHSTNDAGKALYYSAGFRTIYEATEYSASYEQLISQ